MPPSPSHRLLWLPLLSALLSGGLWTWSTHLPDTVWESSTPASLLPPPSGTATAQGNLPEATPSVAVPETSASPAPARTTPPEALAAAPSDSTTPPVPTPTPGPAPLPTDAELAGPLPQHSPEELASRASTQAAAPATISTLTLADIAHQPELWPKQVVLLVSARFPAILKGVNVGNIQVPAGRAVLVRKVNLDGTIDLELPGSQGAMTKVKAQATDLIARAQALATSKEKASPTP